MAKDGLTPKQRRFCECVISGMNPSDAYRTAYNAARMSRASVANEAYRLMNRPDISPIIERGVKDAVRNAVWNRKTALERLLSVNTASYRAIVETGDSGHGNASAFFESFDRLNIMAGITGAVAMPTPVFYFDPSERGLDDEA